MSKKYINYNINETVRVKLTDFGRKIHKQKFDDFIDRYPLSRSYYTPPLEDKDGWSEWQGWVLMETFGEYLVMGGGNPFETTIQIPVVET